MNFPVQICENIEVGSNPLCPIYIVVRSAFYFILSIFRRKGIQFSLLKCLFPCYNQLRFIQFGDFSVYKFLSAKNSAFLWKIEANSSWNLAKIKLSAPFFSEIQFSFHFRHADEIFPIIKKFKFSALPSELSLFHFSARYKIHFAIPLKHLIYYRISIFADF